MLAELKKLIVENLSEIIAFRENRILKSDNSFVTQGDLFVQKLVCDWISERSPETRIVSEELRGEELEISNERVLVIDPIDGTENFTSGLPEWGVALCLYERGVHVDSLLFCPELDLSIRYGDRPTVQFSRIAGISSSLTREDLLNLTPGFEYRIMGCCVYNMINVLRGAYATFENPKGAWIWDIIGGLNIARAAGLTVTVEDEPYDGRFLATDRKYRFKISR